MIGTSVILSLLQTIFSVEMMVEDSLQDGDDDTAAVHE